MRSDMRCDGASVFKFAVILVFKTDREGFDRIGEQFCRDRSDQARVQAAAQKYPYRDIAYEVATNGIFNKLRETLYI